MTEYQSVERHCRKCMEKGNTNSLLVEVHTHAATMEIRGRLLNRLKIDLSQGPAVLLLGVYQKDSITHCRDTCYPCLLLLYSQLMEEG